MSDTWHVGLCVQTIVSGGLPQHDGAYHAGIFDAFTKQVGSGRGKTEAEAFAHARQIIHEHNADEVQEGEYPPCKWRAGCCYYEELTGDALAFSKGRVGNRPRDT